MTDDELRLYLKPKHGIGTWIGVAGLILSLLGAAAALSKWAFTAPTREDYEPLRNEVFNVRQDHAVLKAEVSGMRSDLADVKQAQKEILNAQLQQLRITGRR